MAEEKFLTVRDAAAILGVTEKEVVDLVDKGTLSAYKIGGIYLRFKKEQIFEVKKHLHPVSPKPEPLVDYPVSDRFSDFFYFNDFYIVAVLVIAILIFAIFRG